ncbi:hypothetical protein cypCar_00042837 [Cyprinus carpio]|nr:hypothetical protein cypCar_00042837 [Cyprinus carpio]
MRPHSEHPKDHAAKRLSSASNGTSDGGAGAKTPVEITALEESFRRFAIHGDTRATGRDMNGKNWSKLCKDCGVIDGKGITLTDVDIVFSKVKNKSARTITYSQFKEALAELARKRFKDKSSEDAAQEVYRMIEGKSPVIAGVTCFISNWNAVYITSWFVPNKHDDAKRKTSDYSIARSTSEGFCCAEY